MFENAYKVITRVTGDDLCTPGIVGNLCDADEDRAYTLIADCNNMVVTGYLAESSNFARLIIDRCNKNNEKWRCERFYKIL